jgi:hypothetical protein
MAKEQKPTEQLGEIAEQAMEQARRAADIYFDYVKQAISATPSGGNEFAESLKECAEKNITATQEFLKQLSQARNFQDVVRVQSDYMKFLMNAFGEQSFAEAYTKTAADAVKKPLTGMLDRAAFVIFRTIEGTTRREAAERHRPTSFPRREESKLVVQFGQIQVWRMSAPPRNSDFAGAINLLLHLMQLMPYIERRLGTLVGISTLLTNRRFET